MNKRVFITGGTGFIGSHLVDLLVKSDWETATYDASLQFIDNQPYYNRCLELRRKHLKHKLVKVYDGDIRDMSTLSDAVKDFKPQIIVHLAGLPMARALPMYADEMLPINMQGTLNVLDVFEKSSAKRVVYTSSSMSYGHFKQTPQSEEFLLDPINSYGACKAAGEYFVKLSKKEWVILRPTSVYGFTDCANRVTQLLLDAAFQKKSAWVVKGETLDFSYVKDVAAGFLSAIESKNADHTTFNISRGEARAASEFAEVIKQSFPKFDYEVREPSVQQVWRGPLDISKAKSVLEFRPKYDIEKGIQETVELIQKYDFYNF